MRGVDGVLGLAAILAAVQPLPVSAKGGELTEVSEAMSPPALCSNLRQVALRKAAREKATFDPTAAHAAAHEKLPAIPVEASLVIKVLVGGGMSAYGPAGLESIIAWRSTDGRWRARRAEERAGGQPEDPEFPLPPLWPDPQPKSTMDGHIPAPSGLIVSEGDLPGHSAMLLDRALLRTSCIHLEPPRLPPDLPLKNGARLPCVPDSASWHVEIRRGDVVQRYERPCRLLGPIGLIAKILDRTPLPGAAIARRRADLYNGNQNASVASLQAFLTERLPGVRYRDDQGEGAVRSIRHLSDCEAELNVEDQAGRHRAIRMDWRTPKSFPMWISDGVVKLGPVSRDTGEDEPGARFWIAPGTTLALQLQGALWNLSRCGA